MNLNKKRVRRYTSPYFYSSWSRSQLIILLGWFLLQARFLVLDKLQDYDRPKLLQTKPSPTSSDKWIDEPWIFDGSFDLTFAKPKIDFKKVSLSKTVPTKKWIKYPRELGVIKSVRKSAKCLYRKCKFVAKSAQIPELINSCRMSFIQERLPAISAANSQRVAGQIENSAWRHSNNRVRDTIPLSTVKLNSKSYLGGIQKHHPDESQKLYGLFEYCLLSRSSPSQ